MHGTSLTPGDPAPVFVQPTTTRPAYHFSTAAGRYVVLSFFGSAARADVQGYLERIRTSAVFADGHVIFLGVSHDPEDAARPCAQDVAPGFRTFLDFRTEIAKLYGVLNDDGERHIRCRTFVLDPNLRILAVIPVEDWSGHGDRILTLLAALPPIAPLEASSPPAPILVVPRVFEPEFCRELMATYAAGRGEDSGFMEERQGRMVGIVDHAFKRRRDCEITDERLRRRIQTRMYRRLNPEIAKAFCFHPTRIERYIVACYDAKEGGYFRPHRDNMMKGTAHRRFAVTINLNAEEYSGGDLHFPEYGSQLYKAPTGGAIVFSCSLLHEATPVTSGRRFAFLPFLYDEAAAQIRAANLDHIADPALREAVRAAIVPVVPRDTA